MQIFKFQRRSCKLSFLFPAPPLERPGELARRLIVIQKINWPDPCVKRNTVSKWNNSLGSWSWRFRHDADRNLHQYCGRRSLNLLRRSEDLDGLFEAVLELYHCLTTDLVWETALRRRLQTAKRKINFLHCNLQKQIDAWCTTNNYWTRILWYTIAHGTQFETALGNYALRAQPTD